MPGKIRVQIISTSNEINGRKAPCHLVLGGSWALCSSTGQEGRGGGAGGREISVGEPREILGLAASALRLVAGLGVLGL